jgi:5'-nucleotidase
MLTGDVASGAPLRVLVTNDDGIGAPGITALVARLAENPELELHLIAPAENQSGTGDRFSREPIAVTPGATADGFAGLAVHGFPADTVLYGVQKELAERPDLVVSGINLGQNIAEVVNISGTVGAALTAARMGIPAIALSQGLAEEVSYVEAADYAARLVERFRTSSFLRALLTPRGDSPNAQVLNVNFPTCTSGSLRGVRAVRLGRTSEVVGYEDVSSDEVQAIVETIPPGSNDCTSTLSDPTTDLEAMNNGFASVTPLAADLTDQGLLGRVDHFVEEGEEARVSRCVPARGGPPPGERQPIGTCRTRLARGH